MKPQSDMLYTFVLLLGNLVQTEGKYGAGVLSQWGKAEDGAGDVTGRWERKKFIFDLIVLIQMK